jgi:hypothetical protein
MPVTLRGAGEDGGEGGLRQGSEVAQIGERWSREGNQMATVNELRDALRDERAALAIYASGSKTTSIFAAA